MALSADTFHAQRLRRELGELVTLAWPVVLSRLGQMMMGVTDVVVVGRYSARELGYQSLGWAPTAVIMVAGIGLLAGVQIITARHIGEGRPEATGGVLRRGLVYAFWLGLASAIFLYLLGGPAMRHAGLDPDLAAGSTRVLQVLALSMPFMLLSSAATYFVEALSRPKVATVATWACNAVNLIADLTLVGGLGAIPAFGAVGACWATFASRGVLTAWLLIWIARMPDARALGVFSKPIDGRKAAIDQRRVGYGGGASYFVEAGAFAGMNLIAGWLGALAVAGWAIVLNVTAVVFMIPLGLSAATSVLVGRAYGAKDRSAMIRAGNLGFGLTAGLAAAISVVVLAAARPIAAFYSTDAAVIAATTIALMIACLYFIFDGLQAVAAQALRARNDVVAPTLFHVISYAAVMWPLSWALAHPAHLGLNGIVFGVTFASVLSAGLLVTRFWSLARRPILEGAPAAVEGAA